MARGSVRKQLYGETHREQYRVWVPTEDGRVDTVASRLQLWRLNVLGLVEVRVRPGLPLNATEARRVITKWATREKRLAKEIAAARYRALVDPSLGVEWEEGWEPGGKRILAEIERVHGKSV